MCPFGDIKDVPDSCVGKSEFFIVGSSCTVCPLSKNVLHMSLAGSCAELESVTELPPTQPTPGEDSATQALLSWSSAWVEQYIININLDRTKLEVVNLVE